MGRLAHRRLHHGPRALEPRGGERHQHGAQRRYGEDAISYCHPHEADGLDEILCPTDLDWYDPLRDDWLREQFDTLPAHVNLTVVMDCCHSGSNTRERIDRAGLHPITCLTRLRKQEKERLMRDGHVVVADLHAAPKAVRFYAREGYQPNREMFKKL